MSLDILAWAKDQVTLHHPNSGCLLTKPFLSHLLLFVDFTHCVIQAILLFELFLRFIGLSNSDDDSPWHAGLKETVN